MRFGRRRSPPPSVALAFDTLGEVLGHVESARRALASAAPAGRTAGAPPAEALAAFEQELRTAGRSMPGWRVREVEDEWNLCRAALGEAERRGERFRWGADPAGYEELYGQLGEIMAPLDAFESAIGAFRRLGC